MSRLLRTIEKIQETQAAIYKIEGGLRHDQLDETVKLTLSSLQKMQRNLEAEFAQLSHAEFLDVCSYRFINELGNCPSIAALSSALSDFQTMFTVVVDAVRTGPKERASYNEEIAKLSSFSFGYTFAGSVGFVMTMPNDRLLFGDSDLDQAIDFIFKISKAETSEQIASFARQVGVASIRKIYEWAKDHVGSSMSADIQWKRNNEVRSQLLIQTQELEQLIRTIDTTSEESIENITWNGKLVGFDTKTRTFHLEFEKGTEDIKGRLAEGFRARGEITIDTRYEAKIQKVTTIHYSTEKEDVRYYLVYLE